MRAGVDTALARVVSVFGQARAHHAYLLINKRANRMKVLVHDGFGLWLCARRLYEGSCIRVGMTSIDADIAAISLEIEALLEKPIAAPKKKPRRTALAAALPRREIRHEPEQTQCNCGCALERIGEDISEKLHYVPGVFDVERHIRGKWVCGQCEALIQAPVPPHVIDKGIPTTGLLAQVLIPKYIDHVPLYRQESIFGRAGVAIARSTLAQWVGTCGVKIAAAGRLDESVAAHPRGTACR